MSVPDQSEHRSHSLGRFLKSRTGVVLIGFLVIASVLLFTEHRAHVLGALVFLPLLLCPLMHLFMHGGHGSHGDHAAGNKNSPERTSP